MFERIREWIAPSAPRDDRLRQLVEQEQLLSTRLQKLLEWDFLDNFVDPREKYLNGDELWSPLGVGGRDGQLKVPFQNWQEHQAIRAESRYLCETNEYAINGIENRISYIVGEGHTYKAVARKDVEVPQETLAIVQAVLDEFVEENDWGERQQELVRRNDRDGESFLRFFTQEDGRLIVRFVEPGDVKAPNGTDDQGSPWSYGIHTEPNDVETVLEYCIDGEIVPADQVQHRKCNVDRNVKRGRPIYYPVRSALRGVSEINRNVQTLIGIQTAIAMIRKHGAGVAKGAVQGFSDAMSDFKRTNPLTGKTDTYRRYAPGTIIDAGSGIEYDFPANSASAAGAIEAAKHRLRSIASLLTMPEFMLTSDASNANYASTLVAEGPAVKMFLRWQWQQIRWDLRVLKAAIAARAPFVGLGEDILKLVEVAAEPPSVSVRDQLKEAQANSILFKNRIISPQTWSAQAGLEYDREQSNIDDSEAEFPGRHTPQSDPLGGSGMGNLDPAMAGALQGAREAISGWRNYP